MLKVIQDELAELKAKYGDERRTKVHRNKIGEFKAEDLIPDEETIVTLTKTGYIKRMPKNTFKSQHRGGKGVSGMTVKETDEIQLLLSANTHDNLLVFTNMGRVFQLRVFELPEGSRISKGQAIVNLINLSPNETVQSLLAIPSDQNTNLSGKYLFFTTRNGSVKRTDMSAFQKIKSNGLIAIKLADNDKLVWVNQTQGNDQILLVSYMGKSIRFPESDVRPTGRDTMGVRGIMLGKEDYVIAMENTSASKQKPADGRKKSFQDLLIITESGLGKRTPISEYPLQKRGGQGVKVAALSPKTGNIAAALMVEEHIGDIIITTKEAVAIKLPLKNIPQLKRPTQGVILMRFAKKDDHVVAVTSLEKEV
jgi:DNA gyrase subunit A